MKPRIGIVGDGNVGSALATGLERVGYEVRAVGKDPGAVREVGAWGEVVVLAVPFGAVDDALKNLGETVKGKTLVDVTNALTEDHRLALGCTTSGAEELQQKARTAKVVKAFNTVFAPNMATGQVRGHRLTLFAAGDDAPAKETVLAIGHDLGFEPLDAGPLANARWLETLGYFNIQLGYGLNLGTDIGFKLVGLESAPIRPREGSRRARQTR